jgi:hypothetical protein
MYSRYENRKGKAVFRTLLVFCCFNMLLGMALCLTKSPEEKSDYYMAYANQFLEQSQNNILSEEEVVFLLRESQSMLIKAASYTPYRAEIWEKMETILGYTGQHEKAAAARDILQALGREEPRLAIDNFLPPKPLQLSGMQTAPSTPEPTIVR